MLEAPAWCAVRRAQRTASASASTSTTRAPDCRAARRQATRAAAEIEDTITASDIHRFDEQRRGLIEMLP